MLYYAAGRGLCLWSLYFYVAGGGCAYGVYIFMLYYVAGRGCAYGVCIMMLYYVAGREMCLWSLYYGHLLVY